MRGGGGDLTTAPVQQRPARPAKAPAPAPAPARQQPPPQQQPSPRSDAAVPMQTAAAPQPRPSASRGRARTGAANGLVTALAVDGAHLFAAGADDSLWKRSVSSRAAAWEHIGTAENVMSMTTLGRRIYALDATSNIWRLDLYGSSPRWELWDNPPPPRKQHGIDLPERRVALTSTPDGHLWVATMSNKLLRAAADPPTAGAGEAGASRVYWELIRESVGVAGLVTVPMAAAAPASSAALIVAACDDGKAWHWKPESSAPAVAGGVSPKAKPWCPCGSTPVPARRGIAYCNSRLYVVGSDGVHVAELAEMHEGQPAAPQWQETLLPLPPIVVGGNPAVDKFSPTRESERPQWEAKGQGGAQGAQPVASPGAKQEPSKGRGRGRGRSRGRGSGTGRNQPHRVQIKASDGKVIALSLRAKLEALTWACALRNISRWNAFWINAHSRQVRPRRRRQRMVTRPRSSTRSSGESPRTASFLWTSR